jgi:hypothetical protein
MFRAAAASIGVSLMAMSGAHADVPTNPAPIETHLRCTTITNRDSGQPNALGPSSFEINFLSFSEAPPGRGSDARWRITETSRADPQGFAALALETCQDSCYARETRFGGDSITLINSPELRHLGPWAPVPADLFKADITISSGDVVFWGMYAFTFENTAASLHETGICRPILQPGPSAPVQKAN